MATAVICLSLVGKYTRVLSINHLSRLYDQEGSKSTTYHSRNQSTESAESRKLLEQHNLLNGVGMLDTFDPHHQVKTDRRVTFMLC